MRPAFDLIVERLPGIDAEFARYAGSVPATLEEHQRLQMIPSLSGIELRQPSTGAIAVAPLRVAAWNVERCKYLHPTAALLRREAADICLLSEMDVGMARSGNRHTAAELAAELGLGYTFAVEFVELGIGDDREQVWHAGETNTAGLHGNAVLSRFPIEAAAVIPLDAGGGWFTVDGQPDQRRIGGRIALACRIAVGGRPVWFVACHFESRLGPPDRAREMENLLSALNPLAGETPVLLGGDFNTAAMPENDARKSGAFEQPGLYEPCFDLAAAAGFNWRNCNTSDGTQRQRPDGTPVPPFARIDWFFARELATTKPRVVAAVDEAGRAISDHECVIVDVEPRGAMA